MKMQYIIAIIQMVRLRLRRIT